ncbi:hypothetical protein EVAR_23320_1 [Eumeta japonica]|uniref:Uncharacterized protein n=1 Tax=Eumeta variegata TaxID=151549 RepID=A0A4C1Y0V0_EUMVA|nr:hypothetical protein EVAR_23320_1 [Eumeta japonica]
MATDCCAGRPAVSLVRRKRFSTFEDEKPSSSASSLTGGDHRWLLSSSNRSPLEAAEVSEGDVTGAAAGSTERRPVWGVIGVRHLSTLAP